MARSRAKVEPKIPAKIFICVLLVREQYHPPLPGRQCTSKVHKHILYAAARYLVDEGMAEWVRVERTSRNGKVREYEAPAIRLVPRRTWRGKISDRKSGAPMKVMQLVA